jgi:hypothetical protein
VGGWKKKLEQMDTKMKSFKAKLKHLAEFHNFFSLLLWIKNIVVCSQLNFFSPIWFIIIKKLYFFMFQFFFPSDDIMLDSILSEILFKCLTCVWLLLLFLSYSIYIFYSRIYLHHHYLSCMYKCQKIYFFPFSNERCSHSLDHFTLVFLSLLYNSK